MPTANVPLVTYYLYTCPTYSTFSLSAVELLEVFLSGTKRFLQSLTVSRLGRLMLFRRDRVP